MFQLAQIMELYLTILFWGVYVKPLSLYAKAKVEIENFIQENSYGFDFETVTKIATAFGFRTNAIWFNSKWIYFELLKNKILGVMILILEALLPCSRFCRVYLKF